MRWAMGTSSRRSSAGIGENSAPVENVGVHECRIPVYRVPERAPPEEGISHLVKPRCRTGQVEVDESRRQPLPEYDVAWAVITVADQLRVPVDGRRTAGAGHGHPHSVRRRYPALRRVVELAYEARETGKDVVARGFGGQRPMRHVASNIGQHLAALIIDAQWYRRTSETCAVQVREICLNGRGVGPGRPSYGVADPDDSGGSVAPGERYFLSTHK
jgi:hypothetical protein